MILATEDARRHFGEKERAYAGHDDKKVAHKVKRRPTTALCFLFLLVPVSAGCRNQTPAAVEPMLAVPISHPVQRAVTDYVDFTGRTDAVQSR